MKKYFAVVFFLSLFMALAAPSRMMADEWNEATKVTFSGPVEVPGRVLEAGTYWFVLGESDSNRNIVQIWDGDRMRLITTILAIPDYRLQPNGNTVISFEERPPDQPEAIHAWFYPGQNFGQEFVYPKTRATALAKQTSQPVLSMRDQPPSDQAEIKQVPVSAITASGEEIGITEIISEQPPMPQEAASTLPQTASPLPLLGLLGSLALAGAGALRLSARRNS
jgi:LPXTG cell wall anchor motif